MLTSERLREGGLSDDEARRFFETGRHGVDWVFDTIRRRLDPGFAPRAALDFGCSVGRSPVHPYDLNRVFAVLHECGIARIHVELTDHDFYGAALFFQR